MFRRLVLWMVACLALVSSFAGCRTGAGDRPTQVGPLKRALQKPLSPREKAALIQPRKLSSVAQMAKIDGLEFEAVVGFSLVSGLAGKGSDKGQIPRELFSEVRKNLIREDGRTIKESYELVVSRDTSIVEVLARIRPGAGFGESFDVFVRPLDRAVSLEAGYLHPTPLSPFARIGETVRRGSVKAKAKGQVFVSGSAPGSVLAGASIPRNGIVFEGGKLESERILLIRMKDPYVSAGRTVLIEYLLNRRFSQLGLSPGDSKVNYALAVTEKTVQVHVPHVYRRFVQRFADVIATIKGAYYYGPPGVDRRKKLSRILSTGTPEEQYAASVELEGIGASATDQLEAAVGDDWTLLYSGQALVYLESKVGRQRIIEAAGSENEDVRYEAVRFLAGLAGRNVIQTLRAKVFDPSGRISIEAVEALVSQGETYASKIRLIDYDIVALRGVPGGLILKTRGRPLIAVAGVGEPLVGTIEINVDGVGLGSTDERNVGIISGRRGQMQTVTVEATMDNVLATFANLGVPFSSVRKVIEQLEDAGNIPYEVTWVE